MDRRKFFLFSLLFVVGALFCDFQGKRYCSESASLRAKSAGGGAEKTLAAKWNRFCATPVQDSSARAKGYPAVRHQAQLHVAECL